nr:IS66 family insertion sequence element accessory protein TnpB [Nannocystis sp. RBIL2]
MVLGETGVGKERVAGELHRLSGRRGPLLSINCSTNSRGPNSSTHPRGWGRAGRLAQGFEGLSALVQQALGKDPLSGASYLFTIRRRTTAKVLPRLAMSRRRRRRGTDVRYHGQERETPGERGKGR